MAAIKSRNKRPEALKPDPVVESTFEMILVDFRVTKLVAERFIEPENAKIGTFAMEIADGSISVSNLADESEFRILYTVTITGNKVDVVDSVRTTGPKSFSISASVEGKIECAGVKPGVEQNMAAIKQSSIEVVRVLHALTVNCIREEASQMGYRSVRPSLGLRLKQMPQLDIQAIPK